MDGQDLQLFEQSVLAAVAAPGGNVDAALETLGWFDALAVDPEAAVSTLFVAQGQANATSSALSHVVRDALGVQGVLPVVMPALGQTGPPGRVVGDRVVVRGLTRGGSDHVLVVVTDGGSGATSVAVASVAVADLSRREIRGIDPSLGLVELGGEAPFVRLGDVAWAPALTRAQLAVGHELVGASRKMLELARQHALDRVQFGRPIATFQAVRHRLAEAFVAIEMADALLAAGWQNEDPVAAAMAKGLAGRSARTAARHCQQVLAGIGFTTEHDLHRYIRRAFVLDELFGSSARLTAELGRSLLDSRQLPTLLPL